MRPKKKNSQKQRAGGEKRRIHSCDFIELPAQKTVKNASRGIVNNMSSASEYSEASECEPPGRECVQNAIYDSGQGGGCGVFTVAKLFLYIFAVRVSRSNKICVERSEYSEAREQRAPGRERVQNAIYDSGQGADMLSSFLLYLPFESRGIKISSASEFSEACVCKPLGRIASKTKKGSVARRQGQGADYAFQIGIRDRGDIFTYFPVPLKNASRGIVKTMSCAASIPRLANSEPPDANASKYIFSFG